MITICWIWYVACSKLKWRWNNSSYFTAESPLIQWSQVNNFQKVNIICPPFYKKNDKIFTQQYCHAEFPFNFLIKWWTLRTFWKWLTCTYNAYSCMFVVVCCVIILQKIMHSNWPEGWRTSLLPLLIRAVGKDKPP